MVVTGGMWAGERGDWSAKCDESVLIWGEKLRSLCLAQTWGHLQGQRGWWTFPRLHSNNEQAETRPQSFQLSLILIFLCHHSAIVELKVDKFQS